MGLSNRELEAGAGDSRALLVGPDDDSPGVAFAHPSEVDFARILDFYGVKWAYEPRSFLLAHEGERVTEMFTPDFYLPELDLYVELTTMKQSLVTQKNGKLRRLRELYPDVNIRLLYRKDYHRLLAKYGYGPLAHEDTRGIGRVGEGDAQRIVPGKPQLKPMSKLLI